VYLLSLSHSGARVNDVGVFSPQTPHGILPKWTLMPATNASLELLELVAFVCGGVVFTPGLGLPLGRWCRDTETSLHLEALVVPHAPRDIRYRTPARRGLAVEIDPQGEICCLRTRTCRSLPAGAKVSQARMGSANQAWFFLAYGPQHRLHRGTDRFDFSDPFFRTDRVRSLFDTSARLTDPVAFLSRLHHKACRVGRYPAQQTLASLAEGIGDYLGLDTSGWLERSFDVEAFWSGLSGPAQRSVAPLLDAVRHAIDASPFRPRPLDIPCLVIWDRPDEICEIERFPAWAALVDRIFPAAQIVARVGDKALSRLPAAVAAACLSVPPPDPETRARLSPKARRGAVALVQVDGSLPNLALMKLARHYREHGREVVLTKGATRVKGVDVAYASAIFTATSATRRLQTLRQWYGEGLVVGGSGIDLARRLHPDVEAVPADFSLYPELGDRALGFLTRGCPFRCPFCLVPLKEGPPHQVSDFDSLLQGRNKLILLDDNLLAHPQADAFLEEMVRREIQVNFTQTLDLRFVNRTMATLIRRVRSSNTRFTRPVLHFSLNDARRLEGVREKYDLFGFKASDHVEFVCMYGYDTTLEEDVTRFRFLRSLPGAYVFVQEYRPVGSAPVPEVPDFFGPAPDRLISELVSICFAQNMKSMENYYRWLSRRYALQFGRLHEALVNTIFRYNNRSAKGVYLATLAHTVDRREALGPESG